MKQQKNGQGSLPNDDFIETLLLHCLWQSRIVVMCNICYVLQYFL